MLTGRNWDPPSTLTRPRKEWLGKRWTSRPSVFWGQGGGPQVPLLFLSMHGCLFTPAFVQHAVLPAGLFWGECMITWSESLSPLWATQTAAIFKNGWRDASQKAAHSETSNGACDVDVPSEFVKPLSKEIPALQTLHSLAQEIHQMSLLSRTHPASAHKSLSLGRIPLT